VTWYCDIPFFVGLNNVHDLRRTKQLDQEKWYCDVPFSVGLNNMHDLRRTKQLKQDHNRSS
jgi:hypothetical protein